MFALSVERDTTLNKRQGNVCFRNLHDASFWYSCISIMKKLNCSSMYPALFQSKLVRDLMNKRLFDLPLDPFLSVNLLKTYFSVLFYREVPMKEAKEFAESIAAVFIETSARNAVNVEELFQKISRFHVFTVCCVCVMCVCMYCIILKVSSKEEDKCY